MKYLFSMAAVSAALLLAGCKQESIESFDNIKLSDTWVSIPVEGGTASVTLTATENWAFVETETWPVVIDKDDPDNNKDSWLSVDKMEGTAGETVVTFKADKADSGRELELSIKAGANTQFVKVRQGSLEPVKKSTKEINESAVAGATYSTTGYVTKLGNYASYGAFFVNDGKSNAKDVEIYGQTKESLKANPDLEVGDYVEFTGTWSSYGNFQNVEITKLEKSLIKLPAESGSVPAEGGELVVKIEYKGNGVFLGEYDKTWITYKSMKFEAGVPDKLNPNPADKAIFTFTISKNDSHSERTGTIGFNSHSGSSSSDVAYTFVQKPKKPTDKTSINDVKAKIPEEGQERTMVKIEAQVVAVTTKGVVVKDETGALLVYDSAFKSDANKVGDKVTVYGFPNVNDGGLQLVEPEIETGANETVAHGDAKTIDAETFAAITSDAKNVKVEYASIAGTLTVDGSHYNISVEGVDKGNVSVYYPVGSLKLKDMNGKKVTLNGYILSVSGEGKYINIAATSVSEAK